jgi:hypothetical protein
LFFAAATVRVHHFFIKTSSIEDPEPLLPQIEEVVPLLAPVFAVVLLFIFPSLR